jgi:hypothetical protein
LTDDASRAEDVVQETLLRAWQPPEVTCDAERSARAWLFTVARNMIVDGSRSAPSGNVVSSLDDSSTPEWSAPDEVNAALDRLLIGDAMTQLLAEHRTVIDPLLLPGMDHDTDRRRSRNRRRNSEVAIALCRAGTPCHAAGDGGDAMAAPRPIRAPVGPEYPIGPSDWLDTKAALRHVWAPVGLEYLMVSGDGV